MAAGLAHEAPVDALASVRQVLHHLAGTVSGVPFFVAGDEKTDAAVVVGVLADKALAGNHHGGEAAFHIGGSASVKLPTPHLWEERV